MALVSCASPESSQGTGTAGTSSTPPTLGPIDAVRTVVVGDEGTSRTSSWPDHLAAALADDGVPMTLRTVSETGAGFAGSPAFAETVAATADGTTQLVILFDSRLETADAAGLTAAARDVFVEVERAASDARLVVVGPLPGAAAGTDVGDALRAEALDAGALYVDPVADGWPPDAGQEQVADLLRPHVEELVANLAASGANR
jgi:acyl-CoA thioesterase I